MKTAENASDTSINESTGSEVKLFDEPKISPQYIYRCRKTLMEMGAPLDGWYCIDCDDTGSDDSVCELCGCVRVRFMHEMAHSEYDGTIRVGCICAGIMEDDIIGAKERDRQARRRAQRRNNFISKCWNTCGNQHIRKYHGKECRIQENSKTGIYSVWYKNHWCKYWHGELMRTFNKAAAAAFYAYEKETENERKDN